jgi:hypothetical protein
MDLPRKIGCRWFSEGALERMLLAALMGVSVLLPLRSRGEETRSWTDSSGKFKRDAVFQQLDGDIVVLKNDKGETLRIALDRLSKVDQAYVRAAAASGSTTDPFEAIVETPPADGRLAGSNASAAIAIRTVVAQGVGSTPEEAKRDACREAVRQVVGAYVESDTLTRNDELIEDKVLTLSGGLVSKADVIPNSIVTQNGMTRLRIRAEVKVTEVMKSLTNFNITTTAVRTTDMQGQVTTLADQTDAAELTLGDAKSWESVPASFFSMQMVGQPKVLKARGDEATVQLSLQLTADRAQYLSFANRLIAVLSKLEGPRGAFSVDGRNPAAESSKVKEARERFWRHTLIFSENRGNGADPEICYAFPEHEREKLRAYFGAFGSDLPAKSECFVYCFNQKSSNNMPYGLGTVSAEWTTAIGEITDDRVVLCLLTQGNETFNRTKWEWFTCDKSLFPGGKDSPWLRGIECETTLYDQSGEELASDIVTLTEGFGVSVRRYGLPVVMIAPAWVDTGGSWPDERYTYVPKFTFPRWLELTAKEAAAIAEVKCVVRPHVVKPE